MAPTQSLRPGWETTLDTKHTYTWMEQNGRMGSRQEELGPMTAEQTPRAVPLPSEGCPSQKDPSFYRSERVTSIPFILCASPVTHITPALTFIPRGLGLLFPFYGIDNGGSERWSNWPDLTVEKWWGQGSCSGMWQTKKA